MIIGHVAQATECSNSTATVAIARPVAALASPHSRDLRVLAAERRRQGTSRVPPLPCADCAAGSLVATCTA
jgi:hypothetical protein